MTAEIVDLADHRPVVNPGNGAREALIAYIDEFMPSPFGPPDGWATKTDHLLATLWARGFKIAPLEPNDVA